MKFVVLYVIPTLRVVVLMVCKIERESVAVTADVVLTEVQGKKYVLCSTDEHWDREYNTTQLKMSTPSKYHSNEIWFMPQFYIVGIGLT